EPLDRRIFRDQVHGFERSGRINAHHAGSLSTRKSSIARVSMPEAKNVCSASDGLETIGSPRRLNEVLISTGTPVRRSNASRMRYRYGVCSAETVCTRLVPS